MIDELRATYAALPHALYAQSFSDYKTACACSRRCYGYAPPPSSRPLSSQTESTAISCLFLFRSSAKRAWSRSRSLSLESPPTCERHLTHMEPRVSDAGWETLKACDADVYLMQILNIVHYIHDAQHSVYWQLRQYVERDVRSEKMRFYLKGRFSIREK